MAKSESAAPTATTDAAARFVGKDMSALASPQRFMVERAYGSHRATGLVLLKGPNDLDGGLPRHQKLAEARAWLSLGSQSIAEQDWAGAVDCARAGLQALGKLTGLAARLRIRVMDDSVLKLGAAQDLLEQGRTRDAAGVMLKTLEERTRIYVMYFADEVAE